ncbi:Hint domain-containing protein [Planktotalea arctica]|uniref:Hint domain-containing protein n=1 Tax=Planktotalea arctica TaxID=1481893 RepID=UPI000A170EE0|nr:Hint domain-containing protein [Planktotalea arctica]
MGWLAWSGGSDARTAAHASVTPEAPIRAGALVIEAPLPSDNRAATLLEVVSLHPDPCLLRIQSIPGEGFSVLISSGQDVFHALISHTLQARTASFRLTLNWDCDTGDGLLSIEHPGDDALFTRELAGCIPLPGSLVLGALAEMRDASVSQNLSYIGFHKGPLSIGPSPTLDYHTPVLTSQGYRKIGAMQPGDTVISASGNIVPVLGVFKKVTPAFGSNAPVRLRAPYFGLQSDLVIAGTQRLIVGGSDVEYTFGCDSVLIPAQHLINGTAAIAQPTRGTMTYYQLLLPAGEAFIASELALESLFIGRLRRRKDIFKHTTLSALPRNLLPEHATTFSQILRPFEAITLAAMRAA